MIAPSTRAAFGAACLILLACRPSAAGEGQATLRLVRPRLTAAAGGPYQSDVYLNEELRFYFSSDVERSSVTSESVRVVDASGLVARGQLDVTRDCVRFVPDLPLRADLSDAGLRPGTTYRVELAGFPRPDGLRSVAGAPLEASLGAEFTTVKAAADDGSPRTWLLFDDRLQARAGWLRLCPPLHGRLNERYLTNVSGSILFTCDKPIDPTTVHEEDFVLRKSDGERLGLSVRLVENQPRFAARTRPPGLLPGRGPALAWEESARCAVLELRPRKLPQPNEPYSLTIRTDGIGQVALRDFSGQPLAWVANRAPPEITFQPTSGETPSGSYVEDFGPSTRSSTRWQGALPGFDGTPAWNDTGRVEVRYPAAAGTGLDGEVQLGAREQREDLHATRVTLPQGTTCHIEVGERPFVLRSQGALHIEGELVRKCTPAGAEEIEALAPELFFDGKVGHPSATLSAWLAGLRELHPPWRALPWTILIAGGDLVIDGSIRVDSPLLLCAGGRVRVSGLVRGRGDEGIGQVWILGEGGGLDVAPRPNAVQHGLSIDPPVGANPLRAPLSLCAMSQKIPLRGRVARWLGAEATGSQQKTPRGGSWRIHFLPADEMPPGPDFRKRWVDSPALLPASDDGGGTLLFFVEIEVPVGGNWDPPYVDALKITWEESGGPR